MSESTSQGGVFLYCRAGFEGECAAEIQDHAQTLGVSGYCRAKAGDGYVLFHPYPAQGADTAADTARWLYRQLPFARLIFARQWFVAMACCGGLASGGRVAPLAEASAELPIQGGGPASVLWLETPDTNEGKTLSGLCRSLHGPLRTQLRQQGVLREAPRPPAGQRKGQGGADRSEHTGRDGHTGQAGQEAASDRVQLHVCFIDPQTAWVGWSQADNASPWPMGIARLKFPHPAPSRSTLKLEEALLQFLTPAQRAHCLRPGLTAVDLGAAPGGWTWQLVRHGVAVTAVDNGPMETGLMGSGLVEHRREDGFSYRPERPVTWLVCDMVDKPARVAARMADWMVAGWCERAVFNLKLPMKQRYRAVNESLDGIRARLTASGIDFHLAARQLYHDREEITVYLAVGS